ncbi:MAG: nucleotide sugar dehydrogenase [Dehalococcoidia bacterium]|nr:nucleotide sugar dehydrogenase [Dehalococcoidia bacterium]
MAQHTQPATDSVAIVGLGYVGLPLAESFANHLDVVGIDIDVNKVASLRNTTANPRLTITSDIAAIEGCTFVILAVPTPVTASKQPDLSMVHGAAASVGAHLKKGMIVILESTVYPGVTEDVVGPILEQASTLKAGRDFTLAYCPERINPGDTEHTVEKSTKVVSGSDAATLDKVAWLYGLIAGNVYKARDIKTAEACKVIENVQRDLNIALVNELSLMFAQMGLDTKAVLEAAATKWNFHRYQPGMVGGHCIPVDPYYLVFKAREVGYHAQVILAGRAINDSMPKHVAEMTVKALNDAGKVIRGSRVLLMGLTYKEDVADTRESPSFRLIRELAEYGMDIYTLDPYVDASESPNGVTQIDSLDALSDIDAVILAVQHTQFRNTSISTLRKHSASNPVLVDVRGVFSPHEAQDAGFLYRTL